MSDSRFIFRAILGLAAALLIVIGLLVYVWGQADSATSSVRSDVTDIRTLTAELKRSVQSPTHGKDIAIWCGFDQSIEADLLAYISQFHGHVPTLKLPSLDCAAIEAGERASTKTKH